MPRLTRAEVEELLATSFRLVLPHADLTEAELMGLDLRHADLSHATLLHTNLYSARLDGADLSHANLRLGRCGYASLRRAVLRGADLRHACFRGADLRNADLRGALVSCTEFVGAEVEGALVDDVDIEAGTIGFGEAIRPISVRLLDAVPQPVTRGPLTEIPDLEELGVTGFDGIPDLIRSAVDSRTMTDYFMAATAMTNLGPRLLVAGGLPTLLEAVRDGSSIAVDWLAMCGEEARPALAPLIAMLHDHDADTCRRAAYALGEIGLAEPDVLAALEAARQHEDQDVRAAAEQALVTVRRGPRKWDED